MADGRRPATPAEVAPGYIAGPNMHLGAQVEIDVGTFEDDAVPAGLTPVGDGGVATAARAPPVPATAALPDDVYEVRVITDRRRPPVSTGGRRCLAPSPPS
jgi:hypothetical protein